MLTLDILEIVLRFALIGMGLIAMVGWKRDGERLDKCREKIRNLETEIALLTDQLNQLDYQKVKANARKLFEEVEK